MPRDIFVSAGEPSGDLYAARLARALRARGRDIRVTGFGGPQLAAVARGPVDGALLAGAVVGWTGVLRHLGRFARLLRATRRRWLARPPAAVVLVDYPGFNLRLATIARQLGIPAYYFSCPQVWAWGANRLLRMRRDLRIAYPILPFEVPLHQAFGIRSEFLGHPLLDLVPTRPPAAAPALRRAGLDPHRPFAALLPGSRAEELTRHLPVMLAAARRVSARHPRLQWVVIAAPGARARLEFACAADQVPGCRVVEDPGFAIRGHARFAWVASGTATLELGLLGIPQTVLYRSHWLNWAIARRVVKVPYIGLVNLVLGRGAIPELLQSAVTAKALAVTGGRMLRSAAMGGARRNAADLRARLGTPGSFNRVAHAVLADLGRDRAT